MTPETPPEPTVELTSEPGWVRACAAGDLDEDDVRRFDHGERSFAIYRSGGDLFATDGYCTHERQHLADGLVEDGVVECPLHMGQFDIATGEALAGPVCVDLKTYAVKEEDGVIFIRL